jgi:hypothetical protein
MVQTINYYRQNLSNGLYNHITIKYVLFKTVFWKSFSIIKIKKKYTMAQDLFIHFLI